MKTRGSTCIFLMSILAFSIFLVTNLEIFAQSLTYKEKSGDKTRYFFYEINENGNIKNINCTWEWENTVLETHKLTLNEDLTSQRWEYKRPDDNTNVIAERKGDHVYLEGIHEGDRISEEFELDDHPWIQLFPMNPGLENFIMSNDDEIRFWAFGTSGSGDMDLIKFVAEKKDNEEAGIMGTTVTAHKIHLTLSGWRSMFWSGDFFYRLKDKRLIKYDGGGAPGEPGSLTVLVEEVNN